MTEFESYERLPRLLPLQLCACGHSFEKHFDEEYPEFIGEAECTECTGEDRCGGYVEEEGEEFGCRSLTLTEVLAVRGENPVSRGGWREGFAIDVDDDGGEIHRIFLNEHDDWENKGRWKPTLTDLTARDWFVVQET